VRNSSRREMRYGDEGLSRGDGSEEPRLSFDQSIANITPKKLYAPETYTLLWAIVNILWNTFSRLGLHTSHHSMRNTVAVSLFFAVLLLPAVPRLYAQDSQSVLSARASSDADQGRYSSAKVEIETAIAIDDKQAEPWYQLGLIDGQMADYRGAEQAFRRALTLDPKSAKAHCRLGQTLVAQPEVREDWQGAVAEFRAALQLDPNYTEAESFLGLGLMHLGDIPAAIATLRHAVQLHPAQASAHLDLALALEEVPEGQEEAVTEFRAALAAKPDAPETEASLGELLLRMGRLPEAEQTFRRSLHLNPDLQEAHYGLARVLKSGKQNTEADIEFGIAADLEQRKPEGIRAIRLNNEGLQLAAKGDLPGAATDLREAILLKPDYGVAKYNLGLILADSGDLPAAKQPLIDAASLIPAQAAVWFDLGRVLALLGESCRASESLFWATRLAPANPKYSMELAKLRHLSSGHDLPATQHDENEGNAVCLAPKGRPNFGAVADTALDRTAFAKELRAKGDLPGATGELMRALELTPNAVGARTELAEIYAFQLRWSLAIEEYRKIQLVAGEGDASFHLALGHALLKEAHAAEAIQEFDKALKLRPDSKDALTGREAAQRALVRP
jgi:tetratricopeptide (TPR) repeat protein